MSFGQYTMNTYSYPQANPYFKGKTPPTPLAKPIDTVSRTIENTVDTFIPETSEETKKSNKKAIIAGSSALVITGLVALLNPKFSSKLINKLKNASNNAGNKLKDSKESYLKSKFHETTQKALNSGVKVLEFSNNVNSAKDVGFKWLCCTNKNFSKVKNETLRNILIKIDKGFVSVMSKFHNGVSKWFDKISKKTVISNYTKASKKMDNYESALKEYGEKLTGEDKKKFDELLTKIKEKREYFSNTQVSERISKQEKSMENLEKDIIEKIKDYKDGFSKDKSKNKDHIKNNMSFWAEEIMMPERNKLEKEGLDVIEELIGNGTDKKGLYDELYTLVSKNLDASEKSSLENLLKKTSKKLKKASHSENVDYFDKKRDLVLGSAPTDIVTAAGGLALSGVAIASADTKEERISRALTGGLPIIAGIGASMAFTAMLFSGIKGMLYGAATSVGLSKLGSIADKCINGKTTQKQDPAINNSTSTSQQKGAIYA